MLPASHDPPRVEVLRNLADLRIVRLGVSFHLAGFRKRAHEGLHLSQRQATEAVVHAGLPRRGNAVHLMDWTRDSIGSVGPRLFASARLSHISYISQAACPALFNPSIVPIRIGLLGYQSSVSSMCSTCPARLAPSPPRYLPLTKFISDCWRRLRHPRHGQRRAERRNREKSQRPLAHMHFRALRKKQKKKRETDPGDVDDGGDVWRGVCGMLRAAPQKAFI